MRAVRAAPNTSAGAARAFWPAQKPLTDRSGVLSALGLTEEGLAELASQVAARDSIPQRQQLEGPDGGDGINEEDFSPHSDFSEEAR